MCVHVCLCVNLCKCVCMRVCMRVCMCLYACVCVNLGMDARGGALCRWVLVRVPLSQKGSKINRTTMRKHTFSRIKHRSIIAHVEAYAPLRLWCGGLTRLSVYVCVCVCVCVWRTCLHTCIYHTYPYRVFALTVCVPMCPQPPPPSLSHLGKCGLGLVEREYR